jgi:protein-L-isoaspartate(D-aspartate) O-methyltransferase
MTPLQPETAETKRMLDAIEADVRMTARETGRNALGQRVMEAMARVPRHRFVPPDYRSLAYANRPLPIGHGQTISQPYIVALMTDLLNPQPHHRVLEIGTGCGYQTAVLAELVAQVYSVEIVSELSRVAGARLSELGYGNIHLRSGDGFGGWKEQAPFDGVLVTAAPDAVPHSLLEQLAPHGRLVVPIGPRYGTQMLTVATHGPGGTVETATTIPVVFVPMIGGAGPYRAT